MKIKDIFKLIVFSLFITFFTSGCNSEKDVLINGFVINNGLNLRADKDVSTDNNIIGKSYIGDDLRIVSFEEKHDRLGIFWCEVLLDNPVNYNNDRVSTAWVAYRVKELPYIVSEKTYENIKRMYDMLYEGTPHGILTKAKLWVTQSIYDFTYRTYMRDIKYTYDQTPGNEDEGSSARYTLKYADEDGYAHWCRVRMSSISSSGDEEALYAVVFKESPRSLHFFRQDDVTNRGSHVKELDMSYTLPSDIKSIERRSRKSRVYYRDYYGYKERLDLSYDAIRVRPVNGKERYILYNTNEYTSPNLDNLYSLQSILEYSR